MERGVVLVVAWLAIHLLLSSALAAAGNLGENPYEAQRDEYQTELLIVGGSSSGTAAAITAGRLGIATVWVLRAPRDMGGLSANAINPDSDLPMRHIGGLALEYDVTARHTSGFNVGGRHNGEGYFAPFHVFFNYTREQIDALKSVRVLSNLHPLAVVKNPATKQITAVIFGHRKQPGRRITIRPRMTIDAEIEGDVAFLAGVSMTLLREGKTPSSDPTRDNESYAGRIFTPERRISSLLVAGGALLPGSTQAADTQPATMGWNGSVTLKDYGAGNAGSPWVLKTAPPGYDPREFDWWETGTYGVTLDPANRRWNIDHFLSTIEGWRLPDGRHVLQSMDIRDREANEKAHLAHVIRGLWHLQHAKGQYRYGLSDQDFHEGLEPKYRLSDLGTAINVGDAPLPGLIYMREGRRMVNDHVFGGRLIEDDGSGRFVQKRYWHPRAAYFNAMLVDIHGVHRERREGSGPEGMQLLRLAGFHNFGAPCIPFDVFVPRPAEATGLLVSSAGAYTHQAYAAFPRMETGRIAQGHACAVAACLALKQNMPVHQVDARQVQLQLLTLHGQSLVYFDDTIPGTAWHVVDQMLGARRVPERNDQGVFQREDQLTIAETRTYLERLFRDMTEHPVPAARLVAALQALGKDDNRPTKRSEALTALSVVVGLPVGNVRPGAAAELLPRSLFADIAAGTPLARVLTTWIDRGWIVGNVGHKFRPDEPIPFSEFKRHAFHVLFAGLAPTTIRAVDYRERLAHDTFNRPDEKSSKLASGQAVAGSGSWKLQAGQLLPGQKESTSYFLLDSGRRDVDVSADVFLEQTRNPAAAGLVVRAVDERNMQRFLIQAEGPALVIRIDTLVDGQITAEVRSTRKTNQRGFTLGLRAQGDELIYLLGTEEVHRAKRPQFREATRVGLLNGGGEASRFDNLEVRAAQ